MGAPVRGSRRALQNVDAIHKFTPLVATAGRGLRHRGRACGRPSGAACVLVVETTGGRRVWAAWSSLRGTVGRGPAGILEH